MFFTRKQNVNCGKCKLNLTAENPQLGVEGEGREGILLIASAPSSDDDDHGRHGYSEEYLGLKEELGKLDLDIDQDCWFTTAVDCYPVDEDVDDSHIEYCRPHVTSLIKSLNPRVIIPVGIEAVKSLYAERTPDFTFGIEQWHGLAIPDQKHQKWVCPIYSIHWLERHRDDQAKLVFENDLHKAVSYRNKRFRKLADYSKKIHKLLEFEEIMAFLNRVIDEVPSVVYFDYESNRLRPYKEGSKLLTASFHVPEFNNECWSFPLEWRTHFTRRQQRQIKKALQTIFSNPDIGFIAHNVSMEDSWTTVNIGVEIEKWITDTMVDQHLLDTTPKTKGLKFQLFVRFGIEGYDDYAAKYIKESEDDADPHALNNLEKANLPKVLEYNAYDSLYGYMLYEDQQRQIKNEPFTDDKRKRCFELYNDVNLTLVRTTQFGFRINPEYYEEQRIALTATRDKLEEDILNSIEAQRFFKKTGERLKITSSTHIGKLFYDVLGMEVKKKTKSGGKSSDHEALTNFDHPIAKNILEVRKLDKIIGTYIGQFQRLEVEGMLHPETLMFVARTGRSCIAKGTYIEVVRDLSKHPEGIKIEDVRPGDMVYCYDKDKKLVLRKVLWAGKTGHKEVCEVHWKAQGSTRKGVLKATPEHKIRMINGRYVPINKIVPRNEFHDYRGKEQGKKSPRTRCLALLRVPNDDRLFVTGMEEQPIDHRFIYEQLVGPVGKRDHIHHKDENHLNNEVSNLEKMTREEHGRHHGLRMSPERRAKCVAALKKAHAEGKVRYLSGEECSNYFSYTPLQMLRLIWKAKGRLTMIDHDFDTIKKKVKSCGIDMRKILRRFNGDDEFITKGMLKRCRRYKLTETAKLLKVGYYKAESLYKDIGISFPKDYRRVKHNHQIYKIKYTGEVCDVYDLEIEHEHNFIANGICVHNSSVAPNFQNISKRDAFGKKVVRSGILPMQDYLFGEIDYDTLEVKIFACYCKDPALINYLLDPHSDMHRDQAIKIFCLDHEWQITKTIRFEAKNGWVFALFYGSYWKSCARKIWEKIASQKDLILGKKKDADGNPVGPDIHLKDHLKKKGIRNQEDFAEHLKKCEEKLWEIFHVTREYQENAFKSALEKGYVESYFGFRRGGYIERGHIINSPVQGQGCQCLLESYRQLFWKARKGNWKSKQIGQIHDSMLWNFHPTEVVPVLNHVYNIMCKNMEKDNDWLIVPMGVEASIAKQNKSWHDLIDFKLENGVWIQAKTGENIKDVLELPRQVRLR